MLQLYTRQADRLVLTEKLPTDMRAASYVWLDLVNPTPEEDRWVEGYLNVSIPTREDMEEIEFSSRLYQEDDTEFMTITALTWHETDEPSKTPITFVLKGDALVTVRYAETKPFAAYALRARRPNGTSNSTGELVMLGLLEAIIDRMADGLEVIGNEIDAISRDVFGNKSASATKKTRDLQSVIERIGGKGDDLTMIQESLVSITRLVTYHTALDASKQERSKGGRQRVKLIQRDASSLGDHANFLSNKITFLLDATLGLINLEQNKIIKIFSIAAVVFLPPTLIASIYGMNFDYMPELNWQIGYPWAIGLMIASAILPYLFFKRRGWL